MVLNYVAPKHRTLCNVILDIAFPPVPGEFRICRHFHSRVQDEAAIFKRTSTGLRSTA